MSLVDFNRVPESELEDLEVHHPPHLQRSQKKSKAGETGFLESLKNGVDNLKGVQSIITKPGRAVEGALNTMEVSMTDGWKNILRTTTQVNGILSGISIFLIQK